MSGTGQLNHCRPETICASSARFAGSSHHICASCTAINNAFVAFGCASTQSARIAKLFSGCLFQISRRVDRRVADLLVLQLLVPRLADTEAIHGADLHVGDHLRRRNDDRLDVLVGIDAAGREPVADPAVVRAAGKRHRRLDGVARRLLLLERRLERLRIEPELEIGVLRRDGDALTVEIEPRQHVHRRRHVVLRDLAAADQIRHRRQDVRAVDAAAGGAEHEVVARRAPRSLLRRPRRPACRAWRRSPSLSR